MTDQGSASLGSDQDHAPRLLLRRRRCNPTGKAGGRDPSYPRPIHILGLIVHNRHVVESLQEEYGIISLDGPDRLTLLEQITKGQSSSRPTASHPPSKARAKGSGLTCVDATCPDVTRTHQLIKDLAAKGYQIIYIGKRGHPEPEGAMGEAPGSVHLVETREDVDQLRARRCARSR